MEHQKVTHYKVGKVHTDYIMETLPPTDCGLSRKRVLRVSTSKSSRHKGMVETLASVCVQEETGRGYVTETHAIYSDLMVRVAEVPMPRVTDKKLSEAHNKAMEGFDDILYTAEQFYANKAA